MKKTLSILLTAMLFCGTLSVYAEARPIYIVKKPSDGNDKKGRSMIILPEASIDGSILSVDLIEDIDAWIYIYTSTGEIAYGTSQTTQQSIIDLQSLGDGTYRLEIVQGNEIYEGEFSIEE